jgi:hypothetical protein
MADERVCVAGAGIPRRRVETAHAVADAQRDTGIGVALAHDCHDRDNIAKTPLP